MTSLITRNWGLRIVPQLLPCSVYRSYKMLESQSLKETVESLRARIDAIRDSL